jgi:hypothetical protein
MSPDQMLDRLRDRIVKYNMLPGTNKAQFRAQMYEEEMVTLARDMALSVETSGPLRLECIRFVVQTARGVPQPWRHDGGTINPEAKTVLGGTVGQAIDAARQESELYQRLDGLVRAKTPYRDWPADIQALAESAPFAELDGSDVLIGIASSA